MRAAESLGHESRFDAEAEGDGNSAQLETELRCKQKVQSAGAELFESSVLYLTATCVWV